MRDIADGATNTMVIDDGRSGSQIELYYRNPTTQEEVTYKTLQYKKSGNKFTINAGLKVTLALAVLTGFREGDFGVGGKPISSDPASSNYLEGWKDAVKKNASDILLAFASAVFEGVRADKELTGLTDNIEYEVVDDESVPLGSSSGA